MARPLPEWLLDTMLVVNIAALNVWAWRLSSAEAAKRQAMTALLRETHPQVRAVLDAPALIATV